jgi:hypothetical protein
MQQKRSCDDGDTPPVASSKKRKSASDAEKVAAELSKINFSHEIKCSIKIEKLHVSFLESSRYFHRNQCTWRDNRAMPCYCAKAKLKFEASLPDRTYLTRFSVRCPSCYDKTETAVHLYCAYCDEVITGTIAVPGGKVSDHLITIRHIYQQAVVLKGCFESGALSAATLAQARDYVSKFDEWSNRIRYPTKSKLKHIHVDALLKQLQILLCRFPSVPPVSNHLPPPIFADTFKLYLVDNA